MRDWDSTWTRGCNAQESTDPLLQGRFHTATTKARTSSMANLRPAVPKLSMSSLVAQEQGLARLEVWLGGLATLLPGAAAHRPQTVLCFKKYQTPPHLNTTQPAVVTLEKTGAPKICFSVVNLDFPFFN